MALSCGADLKSGTAPAAPPPVDKRKERRGYVFMSIAVRPPSRGPVRR